MNTDEKFRKIYKTGAIASVVIICLTLLDIIIGAISGGNLSTIPQFAIDKFAQLQENMLLGLYNLDLLNLIISIFMIPTFLALFFALRDEETPFTLLALIIFLIGTTIFIANNAALPLLDLSNKYNAATTEDQSAFFAAAGEAIIAKGTHGTPGVFPGFALITFSELFISYIMFRTNVFSKVTAYLGLAGTALLFIYLIIITFAPDTKPFAMIIVAPGGILSIVWMIMYTRKLFLLAR
jgi:hypothetical protein